MTSLEKKDSEVVLRMCQKHFRLGKQAVHLRRFARKILFQKLEANVSPIILLKVEYMEIIAFCTKLDYHEMDVDLALAKVAEYNESLIAESVKTTADLLEKCAK